MAIAAALGAAADAVAVTSLDAAAEILATLRREDAGSAALVIAADTPPVSQPATPTRHRHHHRPRPTASAEASSSEPSRPRGPGLVPAAAWCAPLTGWRGRRGTAPRRGGRR